MLQIREYYDSVNINSSEVHIWSIHPEVAFFQNKKVDA